MKSKLLLAFIAGYFAHRVFLFWDNIYKEAYEIGRLMR